MTGHRHRRQRLRLTADHEGHVSLSTCPECVPGPEETLAILMEVVNHLRPMTNPGEWVLAPVDSCEATDPDDGLQCWLSYGHEGEHYVGGRGGSLRWSGA